MAPVLEMCILSTCRPDCAKFNKEDDAKSQSYSYPRCILQNEKKIGLKF